MKYPIIVSAVIPLHNGIKYIEESIESIRRQTFTDWELIIVNDFGGDDGWAEIISKYTQRDERIHLIQPEEQKGLAESLNMGIEQAAGKYIARVDADSLSYPERFERQVKYLENHPEVFMCKTLQRSVLSDTDYVQEEHCESEELKAALLFGCEISHCSVMFRKDIWMKRGYRYNPESLCEDYDLWANIMFDAKIVNIPEVLVEHRGGFNNISIQKGKHLSEAVRQVSCRTLQRFGINVEKEDMVLLSGWRSRPIQYAQKNRAMFLRKKYQLLCEIESHNEKYNLIEPQSLKKILWKRWNWACQTCELFFYDWKYEDIIHEDIEPVVSVVLPVYRAVRTLRETIDSILKQTFEAWELIIVCENGNTDGSTELAQFYSKFDKRIKVICNARKEGLAGSLNIGIQNSRGKYIARIDSDDLANRMRLSTQVSYMEKKKNVGITQFYQHYFGAGANGFIHCPPVSSERMKARLLFFCDACHSTIMIRKSIMDRYQMYYNPEAKLEDYELWTRMINVTAFETIPEVYGEYRVNGYHISSEKNHAIQQEMCNIVARQLSENLGIEVSAEELPLLNGWVNIFEGMPEDEKNEKLFQLKQLLLRIWQANRQIKFYSKSALMDAILAKWRWAKYLEPWQGEKKAASIEKALEISPGRSVKEYVVQKFVKKILSALQTFVLHIDAKHIEHLSNVTKNVAEAQSVQIDRKIEEWTWERYIRMEKQVAALQQQNTMIQNTLAGIQFQKNRIPYDAGEKIRIVFLFQIASFWGAWESFYQSCKADERIDEKLVLLNETNKEKSQMANAGSFLQNNGLEYTRYDDFEIEKFKPHVLVIQTPYDEWHRKEAHWSTYFRMQGYRLVYIPYGIEISDTEDSHQLHFCTNVIQNCWRIYTFSDEMKKDYSKYSVNRQAVRALGLPRFDYYYKNRRGTFPDEIERRREGRRVVIWKAHFPKIIIENGKPVMVTPVLDEYIKFAEKIKEFSDLFFIFMPHPKFYEKNGNVEAEEKIEQIMDFLLAEENVWIDDSEDYRNSVLCSDFIIVDRSAVMIEAAALDVPILYISNADYSEPVTGAVKALVDSYYHANDCRGIINFLQMCRENHDPRAIVRKKAFRECIPFFDGMSGERIKENIVYGIINNED